MGRQSFYYHFQDKFELMEWTYQHEAFAPLYSGVTFRNWSQKMNEAFAVMEQDRKFYITAIRAYPEQFSECLSSAVKQIFLQTIEYLDKTQSVSPERRDFGATFYAMGCSAVVVQWVQKGMKIPGDRLAEELYILAKDSERAAFRLMHET